MSRLGFSKAVMIWVFCCMFYTVSNAQSGSDTTQVNNSFRLKYDAAKWLCFRPNIEAEYRLSEKIAVSIAATYFRTGIPWPLHLATGGLRFTSARVPEGNSGKITEQWPLRGYMLQATVKCYLKKSYFLSSLLYYRDKNYEHYSWGNVDFAYYEDLSIKDIGIGLVFGGEGRRQQYSFGEWFAGLGLAYSLTDKTTAQYNPDLPLGFHHTAVNTKTSKFTPCLFVGYKMGIRMGRQLQPGSKPTIDHKLPMNSVYYEFFGPGMFGSINYERVMLNRNSFYFNIRGGLGYQPFNMSREVYLYPFLLLNGQIQFSKLISIEAGCGVRLDIAEMLYEITPDLITQFSLKMNGPKGFLVRVGINPAIITASSDDTFFQMIRPGISFGYSFGK